MTSAPEHPAAPAVADVPLSDLMDAAVSAVGGSPRPGQQAMAESYALEYPLNPDAALNPDVKPFDELEPPEVDVASLNGPQVTDLMTAAGLL